MSRKHPAFSLVALLVVIGIIAILLAMLLPAMLGARRQANIIKCQANLRQITAGCKLHAHDHRGYMPLAGMIQINSRAVGADAIPRALLDSDKNRYSYATAPNFREVAMIVPVPAAIARYLGFNHFDDRNWDVLDQQLNDNRAVWKLFMCPDSDAMEKQRVSKDPRDTTPSGQGTMMSVEFTDTAAVWSTNSDFGINEAVFGFDCSKPNSPRRLGGKIASVRQTSQVMLFCDANRGKGSALSWGGDPWIMFTPALAGSGPVTLADALANTSRVIQSPQRALLDKYRHKNRLNVAFADGHVEMVRLTPADLQRVHLSPR